MRTPRAVLACCVIACCAVLAGCSGTVVGTPTAASGTSIPESEPRRVTLDPATGAILGGDATAAEAAFRGYYQALLTRDWTTACAYAAPATITALVENVRSKLGGTVGTCEEAFTAIYADAAAAGAADAVAGSARIDRTEVVGDTATIVWSATVNGVSTQVTNQLSLVGGRWLLLDTGA